MNPPELPNPPNTIVLRHPTKPLELVLPRGGSLAELLMTLGYAEVEDEPLDPAANLSTDVETRIDDGHFNTT
jgi:hypothetical protein